MTENKGNKVKIRKKNDRGSGRFMSGVAALTASTVIVKLIGVIYKIPMMRYLGEEGMGYFNSAYEIYSLFYIIATAGLPTAISILVAQNNESGNAENVKNVFRVSLRVLIALGSVMTALIFFGAERFSQLIGNSGSKGSLVAIAPMAMLVCISSAFRGYFQGHQNMVPTAVSQVIEAVGKLFPGLVLAVGAVRAGYSVADAASFATLGITIGVGISAAYLVAVKCFCRRDTISETAIPTVHSKKTVLKKLFQIAVPITVSSAVISLTRVVDLVMILRRLQSIGYTEEAANAVYGSYSTLAVSMFNLPASLVTPIALAIVPVLASALDSGKIEKERTTLNGAVKLCGIIIIPSALGLSVFSRPILELVFAGETAAINVAAPLLSILAISSVFSCLMTVTNAALQAYGKERKPISSMLAGATVKLILSYVLIGIPNINIYGAPISTLICDITVTALNFAHIKRATHNLENVYTLLSKPLLSAAVAIGSSGAVYYLAIGRGWLNRSACATAVFILLAAVVYLFCVLRFKAVTTEELLMLPKGSRVYSIVKKLKLIK